MAGRRPLSQQFAPEDPVLRDQVRVWPREELNSEATRHGPLPEKPVPQYSTLSKQAQQLAPEEPVLQAKSIPRDELNRKPNHHPIVTLPAKEKPIKPLPRDLNDSKNMDTSKESLGNGDLPHDQLIPLEELPAEEKPSLQQPCHQQPPPPVVMVDDQPLLRPPKRRQKNKTKNNNYNSRASQCIGIILIIIGICEIVMNIIGICLQDNEHRGEFWNAVFYLGPGLWCAVFFILCGAFGIVSARRRETWTIVTHLVVATLAAVFAFILLAICGWGLYREYDLSLDTDGQYHLPSIILLSLMSVGAILAIPLTIVASILCCAVFCRKST